MPHEQDMQQVKADVEALKAACSNLKEMDQSIKDLKQTQDAMRLAFPLNDLNKEDYDGHRKEHLNSKNNRETISDITLSTTKYVFIGLIAIIGTIFGLGVHAWITKLLNQ